LKNTQLVKKRLTLCSGYKIHAGKNVAFSIGNNTYIYPGVGWKCLGPHPGSLYWKFCGELSFDIGNISLREIFQSLERAINLMGVPAEQLLPCHPDLFYYLSRQITYYYN